jgi:hypothetical protein
MWRTNADAYKHPDANAYVDADQHSNQHADRDAYSNAGNGLRRIVRWCDGTCTTRRLDKQLERSRGPLGNVYGRARLAA